MNVFIIPSWYPTESFSSVGIFYKEQVRLLAKERPDWNVGVSLWGSHEPKLWLRASRPLHSLIQYASKFPVKAYDRQVQINLAEFFSPAYTWTRRLFNGNINGIIDANRRNFERYCLVYGTPEVIHAHIAYPAGYIAMQLSKEYGIPYLITEQMSPFPLPNFKRDFKKYLLPPLQKADTVLSVGNNLAVELRKYGITSQRTSNFIDLDRFRVQTTFNQTPTILAVGRLVEQKGFDLLLQALAPHASESWQLKIGGSGPRDAQLKKMANRFGLKEKVTFAGELTQTQVADEMQSCDFFVLSSRHESFGIVLLEALACGKPAVYTRCGGMTTSLPDTIGISCDISVDALTSAIGQMLLKYKTYNPEGIRQFVEENYAVSTVANQLESIYRAIAN